jgi:hypothetical protein
MSPETRRFYEHAKSKLDNNTDLPDFFAYHLTTDLGKPIVTVKDVRSCYETCDLDAPSWLASHFSKGLKSKPKRFVRKDGGYRLENARRERISATLGNDRGSVQVSVALAKLEASIVDGSERDFLSETIRCFSAGANRAVVVMCWNLALHHLRMFVLAHHSGAFNQALASNTDARVKIRSVAKIDDFTEMPEGKFLEFCRTARIVTSGMYNRLKARLDERNAAAHPSGVKTTPKGAEAYVEDMIENVVRQYVV